jgi:hypothetical protein
MYSFRKSTQKVSLDDDDQSIAKNSIAFSVDPEMVQKLNIPVRMDQRSALDYDKMYKYQLERDLVKIVNKNGHYQTRNTNFLEARAEDPDYRQLNNNHPLGMHGETKDVAVLAARISWQETTQPFGPIAQRRQQELLKRNTISISEIDTKRSTQARNDHQLWDSIQYGHMEEKRRKKKLTRKEQEEEQKKKLKESLETFQREQLLKDPWKYRLERSQFKEMRVKISKFDIMRNMEGWNK